LLFYFFLQGPIGLDGPRGYTVSVFADLHVYSNNLNRIFYFFIVKCRVSNALTLLCNALLSCRICSYTKRITNSLGNANLGIHTKY